MKENEWVELINEKINNNILNKSEELSSKIGLNLVYGNEIFAHGNVNDLRSIDFQTDITIIEEDSTGTWKPEVVLEAKIRLTTHEAITYNEKASKHRTIYPYLRYGMILGNNENRGIPGRLYRHGQNFDFMMPFNKHLPSEKELSDFDDLLKCEINASRTIEKIIYENRKINRDRYYILHRKLNADELK